MEKIRYGNDITFRWTVRREGAPEDFSKVKTLRLLMRGTSDTIEVKDYKIDGSTITWLFAGKNQRGPSTYSLTLIENEGLDNMFTVDKCKVLQLTSTSCCACDDNGPFTIDVESDICVPSNGLDGKTPVLKSGNTTTLSPGRPASAELVRDGEDENGNPIYKANFGIPEGKPFTYSDFTPEQIADLQKPAVDAAETATKAAETATEAAKEANDAAGSADEAARSATEAAADAGLAASKANDAATDATEASTAALTAASKSNTAAAAATDTNTKIQTAEQQRVSAEQERVSAEQERISAEQTRQTEFAQLKENAEKATEDATAAAQAATEAAENIDTTLAAKQDKTDNSLLTDSKTVSGAINEVHESTQGLIGMTGFRQVTPVNAPVKFDNTFRNVEGKTASTDDYAIYAPLSLTRGQVIAGTVTATSSVAIVSRIDEEGNWIECLVNGPGSAGIYYVAEEDMTVEICCTKLSYPNLRIYSADITKEIAKNTSDVSHLDIASTQPDIEEVDLDEGAEEGTYWHTNGTKLSGASLNCKTVQLEKGDMLFVTGYVNSYIYIIAQVNSDNTAIVSTTLSVPGKENPGQVSKYSFIAAERCTVAVSYYKSYKHEAFIVRAEVNAAVARLAGSMTALHAIYESNGAVYNENTGYWELNGLTDLTEDEMYDIYLWTNNLINQPELDNALSNAPIRTTFAPETKNIYKQANGVSINQMASNCRNLEIFNINSISDSQMHLKAVNTAAHNAFAACTKLREIKQILYLSNLTTGNIFTAAFSGCQQLRKVRIRGLKQVVDFHSSPLISYESLNYIVANATNTAAITITVHDTTYSYLTGSAQPTDEVGGTTEEWQALVTAAAEKQITFITAE